MIDIAVDGDSFTETIVLDAFDRFGDRKGSTFEVQRSRRTLFVKTVYNSNYERILSENQLGWTFFFVAVELMITSQLLSMGTKNISGEVS